MIEQRSADLEAMARALDAAQTVRTRTSPNPWVGAVIEPGGFTGATEPPGGRHAEIVALDAAGPAARGATLYVTLEPCDHTGRTGPCTQALMRSGLRRVVVGVSDPDPQVAGAGIQQLREAGLEVEIGVGAEEITEQLAPYLKHRRTGRPWVTVKLATTLDGRTAAADGTSQWITGPEARGDVARMRAEADAILVGAGTIRVDDPSLTVRPERVRSAQPLRVVLGRAPAGARAQPLVEMAGDLGCVLDELGSKGIMSVLVEGGAEVAGRFHRAGLVDRYVFYLAPALMGGEDGRPVLAGSGTESIAGLWRGRIRSVDRLGDDLRVEVEPSSPV
ncbi:MAG: bifunctional diaminohydroxyphosphoribosylaminopyrimidine deaminase/5-amino-6-(5-phosphoribosylamino)uracil reductase RibD [Acidimicrobiales bacterium]